MYWVQNLISRDFQLLAQLIAYEAFPGFCAQHDYTISSYPLIFLDSTHSWDLAMELEGSSLISKKISNLLKADRLWTDEQLTISYG
jgi:hypothetical protein